MTLLRNLGHIEIALMLGRSSPTGSRWPPAITRPQVVPRAISGTCHRAVLEQCALGAAGEGATCLTLPGATVQAFRHHCRSDRHRRTGSDARAPGFAPRFASAGSRRIGVMRGPTRKASSHRSHVDRRSHIDPPPAPAAHFCVSGMYVFSAGELS